MLMLAFVWGMHCKELPFGFRSVLMVAVIVGQEFIFSLNFKRLCVNNTLGHEVYPRDIACRLKEGFKRNVFTCLHAHMHNNTYKYSPAAWFQPEHFSFGAVHDTTQNLTDGRKVFMWYYMWWIYEPHRPTLHSQGRYCRYFNYLTFWLAFWTIMSNGVQKIF